QTGRVYFPRNLVMELSGTTPSTACLFWPLTGWPEGRRAVLQEIGPPAHQLGGQLPRIPGVARLPGFVISKWFTCAFELNEDFPHSAPSPTYRRRRRKRPTPPSRCPQPPRAASTAPAHRCCCSSDIQAV